MCIRDSIRGWPRTKSLERLIVGIEEVLSRRGVRFHRSQSAALAVRLRALGGKLPRLLKVLDCVLDPECDRYETGLRVSVERAFEEVFGPGSIVKTQIAGELRRWLLDDVINVEEVYLRYQELNALVRGAGRHVYRRSLIRAAIADVLVKELGIRRTEELLRDLGVGQVMKLLRELRGWITNQ